MDRDQIGTLLTEASKLTHHKEFVIMGSLSVLGAVAEAPSAMLLSIDVDLFPLRDPGRAGEIARSLGQGSAFEREHGYYADAVSPGLAALPEAGKAVCTASHIPTTWSGCTWTRTTPPSPSSHAASRATGAGSAKGSRQALSTPMWLSAA